MARLDGQCHKKTEEINIDDFEDFYSINNDFISYLRKIHIK